MKNIFRIFRRDLKNIFTNWVALAVVIGLMAIPSLYSLINIKASWDPYGNTSGVKVAIVNEDTGTVFRGNDINIGREMVNKLKENDQLGWTFLSSEEAKKGLIMEKYYAVIEIPSDFSSDLVTLVAKDIKRPRLIYTVNEKVNPITPKMTDKAVRTLKGQVDQNVSKTISGILFRLLDEIGINLEKNRTDLRKIIDSVYEVNENMPKIEAMLNGAIDGTVSANQLMQKLDETVPHFSDILGNTDNFLGEGTKTIDDFQNQIDTSSPEIKDKLVSIESKIDNISSILKNVDENKLKDLKRETLLLVSDSSKAVAITDNEVRNSLHDLSSFLHDLSKLDLPKLKIDEAENDGSVIDELKKAHKNKERIVDDFQNHLGDTSKNLKDITERLDIVYDNLHNVIGKVDQEISDLDNGKEVDVQSLKDLRKILSDSHQTIDYIINNFDGRLSDVKNNLDLAKVAIDNGMTLVNQGQEILPDLQKLINTFSNISVNSNTELKKLKEQFPNIREQVYNLSEKLKDFDDKEYIDEILDFITNDWKTQSEFLARPVEIEDNRLFPLPNYGSAATPFYTILCLWIGGYMLSILVDTGIHDEEEFEEEIKPVHIYFGKMLLFIFIGIFQAIIASVGAVFLLKVYVLHPVLFILYSIFVSIVFMIIIYTSVSLFGYGGIIFGIVLLVMQVAGTSGNFPIDVNPNIFKTLFPIFPFTYAISGMRQIMFGIVYAILKKDILILLSYALISIILGISLKKFTNKWIRGFTKKLKESNLMIG